MKTQIKTKTKTSDQNMQYLNSLSVASQRVLEICEKNNGVVWLYLLTSDADYKFKSGTAHRMLQTLSAKHELLEFRPTDKRNEYHMTHQGYAFVRALQVFRDTLMSIS